jgi:tetratricopeptide (TPR) repeat protein
MTKPDPLPTEAWQRREDAIARFEDAYRAGRRPSIPDYLPADGPERLALLVELAHAELEFRLNTGEPALAEEYLDRYPELAADPQGFVSLAESANRLRRGQADWAGWKAQAGALQTRPPAQPGGESAGSGGTVVQAAEGQPPTRPPDSGLFPSPSKPNTVGPTEQTGLETADLPGVPGFEVLDILGRGGMGVVYKARQLSLKRLVALKMILAGAHAGSAQLARFRNEAEAIARLQHPNVVQIHEVGEHNRLPYFSMEYVEGGSLAQRLNATPWPPKKAAALIETIARAVQAAHEKGIIHRDLKPGNILLAPAPSSLFPHPSPLAPFVPKVADFGLAKRLADEAGATLTGTVLGTPSYMAPEQALGRNRDIGPATDVYALGAILYELLTGRPPFKAASPAETLLQVQSAESLPPTRLQPGIPRDLETIVLKAIAKEPVQRYPTAQSLADDIQRYLHDQPIYARPASTREKVWKWARRQPALAALVVVSVLTAVGVTVGAIWHSIEIRQALAAAQASEGDAQQQRLKAESAAETARTNQATAETIAAFTTRLFQSSEPIGLQALGFRAPDEKVTNLTALQLLDRGAERIRSELKNQEPARAALLDTLGNTYRGLGQYDKAGPRLEEALTIRRKLFGERNLETAESYYHLGWLYQDLGEYSKAERFYRQALKIRQELLSPDHKLVADAMLNLAWLLAHQLPEFHPSPERFAESEQLLRGVLRIRKNQPGDDRREVGFTMLALAAVLLGKGESETEARALIVGAVLLLKIKGQTEPAGEALVLLLEADRARQARDFDKAIRLQRQVLDLARRHLGNKHPFTALILGSLAGLLRHRDRQAAERAVREAIDIGRRSPLRWHPQLIDGIIQLADHVRARGDVQEAEQLYREALSLAEYRLKGKPLYQQTLTKLADLLRQQGRQGEAEALLSSSR